MKAFRNYLYAGLAFTAVIFFLFLYFVALVAWRTICLLVKAVSDFIDIISVSIADSSAQSEMELESYWRSIREGKL